MDMTKKILGLFLLSFLAVTFHHHFKIFLIMIEGVPYQLLEHMPAWFGHGDFLANMATMMVLLMTTALYSLILLAGYWLVNKRLMLHAEMLILMVWFIVAVVMTLGPKALML